MQYISTHSKKAFFSSLVILFGLVFSIALWSLYLPLIGGADDLYAATTITVCASGCDYTTLNAAEVGIFATSTDIILEVRSGYVSSSESASDINLNEGGTGSVTLQCQNNSVVIGSSTYKHNVNLHTASSTIQNCTFHNVSINSPESPTGIQDFTVTNNTFSTSTGSSDISFSNVTTFDINNNTGVNEISITSSTGGTINSNIIQFVTSTGAENGGVYMSGGDAGLNQNITYTNNTFINYQTGNYLAANFAVGTYTITTNTFSAVNVIQEENSPTLVFLSNAVGTIRGNQFHHLPSTPTTTGSLLTIQLTSSTLDTEATISHNTFVYSFGDGLKLEDQNDANASVTSTYNIFYSASSSPSGAGITDIVTGGGTVTVVSNYNGFWNLSNSTSSVVTSETNAVLKDPFFSNTSTYNTLSEFSGYLDVNGSLDIGHMSQTRVGTIPVGTGNLVTTYNQVSTTVRSGDTLNFTAGTFDGFTIPTSSITIDGVGATTIFTPPSSEDVFVVSSTDGVTFTDVLVQNATASSTAYTMTNSILHYNDTTYIDSGNVGFAANSSLIIASSTSCDLTPISADDTDVTSNIDTTSPINLALADAGGNKVTVWAPAQYADAASTIETLCSGNGVTVDLFVEDVFTVADSVYTFDADTFTDNSITVTSTYTDPPVLTRTINRFAGFRINNSDTTTMTNVTSSNNGYGVWFEGDASSNTVSSSAFSSSHGFDIFSESTGNNALHNATFTSSSASITGTGNVNVLYKARASVTDGSDPLGNVVVTFTRNDSGDTANVTTTAGGTTPYTDFLLAYTMTSSSIAQTNGSYNPWTAEATTSTYSTTNTSSNLISPNQTFTLAMSALAAAPSAPTSLTTSSIDTTSIGLSWTDNASSTEQEDNFILDYITGSDSGDFPGTTSTVSQDATTTTVSSLTPNTQYTFRIAATNASGTSAYATSSAVYTNPNVPGTPAVTASGETSVTVSWSANSNPSGTVYEVYNVTAGSAVATTTDTSYSVTGLSAGTSYTFKIRAQYLSDNSTYSAYSSTGSGSTTSASSGGGGSSGGSSSAPPAAPAAPPTRGVTTQTVTLSSGETMTVEVGGETHQVTTIKNADGSVSITVQSDPVTVQLSEGESTAIDTDADGENDVLVLLINDGDSQGAGIETKLVALDNLEFVIHDGVEETKSRNVTLRLNSPDATLMAISNTNEFAGLEFETYSKNSSWTLTEGNGEKTVYVKLRTAKGGEKTVSDSIMLVGQDDDQVEAGECALQLNQAYKIGSSPAVYYISEAHNADGTINPEVPCSKRPFASAKKYFTYFDSWDEVTTVPETTLTNIPADVLGFMPQGPKYDPQYGALVKVVTDPKVYLLLGGNKHWITSETVFTALNYSWNWIEDVASSLLTKYTNAGEITNTQFHPNYTLIKYENDSKVYRLEPDPSEPLLQVKRHIADEATFESLNFRWDRIVTIPDSEVYKIGEQLTL